MLRKVNLSLVFRLSSFVRDLVLSVLSGIILALSFSFGKLWILAWFGFVPFFLLLENKSNIKAFLLSYFTGVIFWFGIIYWLIHVTLPGMIILVLYLALYFGFFGLFISCYSLLPTPYSLLFIPATWVILEYLRSHLLSGFPWALLGYSQYLNLPVIQIADITGVWGVSFLVMLVNVAIYLVVRPLRGGFALLRTRSSFVVRRIKGALLPILLVSIVVGYGYYKLNQRPTTNDPRPIKISVIQGNIPQDLKWDVRVRDLIMHKYLKFSLEAINKDKPDLTIWPEAALPVVLEEEPQFSEIIKEFVKENNTLLLLGAVTLKDGLYYNSALLISRESQYLNKYDKLHLVPFGEYIPWRNVLQFLETVVPIGDFTSGREYTIFTLPTTFCLLPTKFSVLICFEDIFPELGRRFVKEGAQFLVNITNDAWFGQTSSPYQHLSASVFRAVENRVYLVRAANTGVSGFISPKGRILSLVQDRTGENIFIDGYVTENILIPQRTFSFYTQYGDVFVLLCLILIMGSIIMRHHYAQHHPLSNSSAFRSKIPSSAP